MAASDVMRSLYKPLDPTKREIRVFQLLYRQETHFECRLKTVSLDDWTKAFYPDPANAERIPNIADKTGQWLKSAAQHDVRTRFKGIPFPRWRLDTAYTSCVRQVLRDSPLSSTEDLPKQDDEDLLDLFCVRPRFVWGDFQAISYCWGESKTQICIDGQSITIPANLASALTKFCFLPEARHVFFWADAICISQENTAEKNHQVAMMRDIFESALSVIAWLGPADLNKQTVSHELARFSHELRQPNAHKRDIFSASPVWNSAIDLFTRDYWRRLWIIQELALNQNMTLFILGMHQHTRRDLLDLAEYGVGNIEEIYGQLPRIVGVLKEQDAFDVFEQVYSILRLSGKEALDMSNSAPPALGADRGWYFPSGISQVLDLAQKAGCTNPSDKVFGLAGLIAIHTNIEVVPDYNASAEEVYEHFARSMLGVCGLESVLSWCSGPDALHLPSWVPDWTSRFPRNHVRWLKERKADGQREERVIVHGARLKCSGMVVDTVASLSLGNFATNDNLSFPAADKKSSRNRYGGKSETSLALSSTLLMDHHSQLLQPTLFCRLRDEHDFTRVGNIPWYSASNASNPALRDIFGMFQESGNWFEFDKFRQANADMNILGFPLRSFFPEASLFEQSGSENTPMCLEGLTENWYIVDARYSGLVYPNVDDKTNMRICALALRGRRLATTRTGWLALVPDAARNDDVLAIIYGCGFPVVLRPSSAGFQYLGECYVHGLMDGEAVDMLSAGLLQETEFDLI